jgi:hypothetical protein
VRLFETILKRMRHIKDHSRKILKKKQVEENTICTRYGVAATENDIVLSSIASERKFSIRFGLEIAGYPAITVMTLRIISKCR